ncbi:MAG: ABC transporter ATP-binding protein [Armatimonadetes bacterium]|nr:ABC transporter ATP-binding protein [Armatimonadota bacterium]
MRGASLTLETVRFSYGAKPVLEGLDLHVPAGGMVALLGPNGSGKSTLLNLVTGVLRPRAGRVRIDSVDLAAIPPRVRARRIAMVPQMLSVPFAFTVREWVSLGRTPYLSPLGGERAEDKEAVARAMQQAQVEDLAERLVGEISGGERQRAALALALAQQPALLLLDEATAHLDVHHQMALLALVRHLNREEGLTVLAAIHDLNLAALWFDRLLLLHDRHLVADGPSAEVLRPELLESVFRSRVSVLQHPTEGVSIVALQKPVASGEEVTRRPDETVARR